MTQHPDTFVARYPDGRRVTLRVKRDIDKLDDLDPSERLSAMLKMFPNPKRGRSFNDVMKGLADRDASDDLIAPVGNHHASQVADLLVESGKYPHRAAALDHLLHSSRGQALLSRMHKKDDPPMTSTSTHAEFVRDVVKQYGIVALAKSMVKDQKAYGLDEHAFTQLATEHAARLYPNDRPDAAFSKLYQSEESVRRACAIAKAWPMPMSLEPMVATGASGFPSTRLRSGSSPGRGDDADDLDAYEQLVKMAEQQRRAGESASQAFERIYLDPANRHLAESERMANRPQPTTYFPMPVK
jgi:hypothetical protein